MTIVKPHMSFEKAVRYLPSFVSHCANGISDLSILRFRVLGERKKLMLVLLDKLGQPRALAPLDELQELDRKCTQLLNFLENTQ